MKKINFAILLVTALCLFSACSKTSVIEGEYEYEDTIYLCPLSSATFDYFKEQREGMKYVLGKDSLTITDGEDESKYESISFEREKLSDDMLGEHLLFGDTKIEELFDTSEDVYRNLIYTEDGVKLNYALIEAGDELYICIVSNDKKIIFNIDKLKKAS